MIKKKRPDTRAITDTVRFSYCHIFKARAMEEGDDPKFSVSLLIPKTDTGTVKKIEKAIDAAIIQGVKEKWSGKMPAPIKLPMRDGDTERPNDDAYKGMFFVNANTKTRPEVVDANGDPILEAGGVVSGDWGRASINFYPFSGKSKGIAAGLGNVQFTEKGEPLGGGASAADDFADDTEGSDLI